MEKVMEISDIAAEKPKKAGTSLMVPGYYSGDFPRNQVDIIPMLKDEGLTLEEAIEMLNSQKDRKVFWSNKHLRKGFYFNYHQFVKQPNGEHRGFPITRLAAADETIHALHAIQNEKLDRRLTLLDKTKDFFKELWHETRGSIAVFGALGALVLGAWLLVDGTPRLLKQTPESYKNKAAFVAESMLSKDNDYAEAFSGTTPDLIARASSETGVSEDVLRAMAAYGMSEDSKVLRDKGYVGLIPVDPFEAGIMPEILESDDYASMLAFAEIYRQIRQDVCDDETALGVYLASEEEVVDAKEKAEHAYSLLHNADEYFENLSDDVELFSRLIALKECVMRGEEPGESLFEPVEMEGGLPGMGTEKDLRRFYNVNKLEYSEYNEHFSNHYDHLKKRLRSMKRQLLMLPEKDRKQIEIDSVWFTNLPEYASRVISRVEEVPEWD